MSEKCRDYKGLLAEYGNLNEENENNNNNNYNYLTRAEKRAIYDALIEFKPILKWNVLCAAHLLDPRFSDTLLDHEEIEAGLAQIRKRCRIMFGDDLWNGGMNQQVMNLRMKNGVFARQEFRSLSEDCTLQEVINVYNYIWLDYKSAMPGYLCKLATDLLCNDGTNAAVERGFNFYSLDITPQNNALIVDARDKKAFIWNSMKLRNRLHDYNTFLYELDLQR